VYLFELDRQMNRALSQSTSSTKNDIAWFLEMNVSGEKVRKAKEFTDSVAGRRLDELFQSVKK
jgi:hypothetical protein